MYSAEFTIKKIPLLLFLFASSLQAQICVVDRNEKSLCLEQSASRIISLAPHTTELLFAVGAGEQVIGVMSGSDYPPAASGITPVGNYQAISLETIISLKPDLVVSWPSGNPVGITRQLARFNIPVYQSDPAGVSDIAHDLLALGKITGNEVESELAAEELRSGIQSLHDEYSHKAAVASLLMISDVPMMGLSNAHAVAEAFHICGAVNVLGDMKAKAPMLGKESMLMLNPDLILVTHQIQDKNAWLIQRGFYKPPRPAVATLNPDLILRQTPRMLAGITDMCEKIEQVRVINDIQH